MARSLTRRHLIRNAVAGGAALATPLGFGELIDRALAVAPSRPGRLEDIEHVVFFIQENRSFDHYFGTHRGVAGFSDPAALPGVFAQPGYDAPGFGGKLLPFRFDSYHDGECTNDITHDWGPQHRSFNAGRMDGFVREHIATNKLDGPLTMGYYTRADLAFYYALADAFTICDKYFCSTLGPTDPNRLYSLSATVDPAGTHGGPILSTSVTRTNRLGKLNWTTMPEQLRARGISWKVYGTPDATLLDNVLPFFAKYLSDPGLLLPATAPTFPGTFELDAASGQLPQVSWVLAPVAQSEHPPGPVEYGQNAAATMLDALTSNAELWAKTAVFITHDENGGFFDHVPPPVAPPGTPGEYLVGALPSADNAYSGDAQGIRGPIGLGFRVPMLIVSPFSRGGFVCSDTFDHTSMLRFLETRFGAEVPNLTSWRRGVTGDMTSAFNFIAPDRSVPQLPATSLADPRVLLSDCAQVLPGVVTENLPGALQSLPVDILKHYPVPPNSMPKQEPGRPRRPSGLGGGALSASGGGPELNVRISRVPARCARHDFRALVEVKSAAPVRFVHVRINGRVVLRTRRRRFTVPVQRSHLHPSANRITAVVRDKAGHQAIARVHFRNC